jgi:hypothetical protein
MNKITLFYCNTGIFLSTLYDELRVEWATLICEVKKLWQSIYRSKCPYYILPEHKWPHYSETETEKIFRENYEAIQEAQTWLAIMSSYLAMKAKDKADIEALINAVGEWEVFLPEPDAFRLCWGWMVTSYSIFKFDNYTRLGLFHYGWDHNDLQWFWKEILDSIGFHTKMIYLKHLPHKIKCFIKHQHQSVIRYDLGEGVYFDYCEYCDTYMPRYLVANERINT